MLSDRERLYLLEFVDRKHLEKIIGRLGVEISAVEEKIPLQDQVEKEVNAYFLGQLKTFTLPIGFIGTEFQKAVWNQVCQIKYGQTSTYQQIAYKMGNAHAARAIGAANGRNHFAIIVPCHRLLHADGSLADYAGGLWRKKWLLEHEADDPQANKGD